MITPSEKKRLLKTLGKNYYGEVSQHLAKRKIKNARGGDFKCQSISDIVCGRRENETVELEIMKLVNKTIKVKKVLQDKRKNLSKK